MNDYFCRMFLKGLQRLIQDYRNYFFSSFLHNLLFISVICFSNCSQNEKQKPVLDKKIMQLVLIDIHTAESAAEIKQLKADSASVFLLQSYNNILHRHHITPEQLFNSFDYYLDNPKKMDAMYQEMIIDLSKKEEVLKSK